MRFRLIDLKPYIVLFVLTAAACNTASFQPASAIFTIHSKSTAVSQTPARQPSLTPSPTPRLLPRPMYIQAPEPTGTPTPEPPPIPTATLATEHTISGIRGHRSLYVLDCETAAALDWARAFGKNFNEKAFQSQLPVSDNPDYGFVGDVNAAWGQIPPAGYGVYPGPVADLLNAYGIPAKAYKGYTLDQIEAKIDQNIPVIAWVIGNVEKGTAHTYTDSEGRTAVVAPYEHVVIVIGYSPTTIRYLSEGNLYTASTGRFLSSWRVLGNMVIVDR